jgi:DNA primase
MGSALTDGHLIKLSRLTTNFILMFDADKAGRETSEKTIELMGSLKKNRFKVLDIDLKAKGKEYDPDDFLNTYGIKPLVKHIKEKKAEIEALK